MPRTEHMALASGTRLGSYEITGAIGSGGMGEVYRARDTKLGREVALKILPEAFAADPDRLMRFEREARTLASLNHPSIAQVYGIEDSTATRALVMELVEGEDLSARVARGPMPVDDLLPIARQISDALEAAHGAGIIHRDLKPANIKLRDDGTVKVLDFGLAKALEPGATGATSAAGAGRPGAPDQSPTITSPAMTMRGVILGTAAYMSPEQAKGRPVDKRADVWAFGAVLYEMFTGARAFDGEDVSDTLALVLRGEPDWTKLPAALPPALRTLVKRCLERDPRRRVGDMSAVRFVLDELAALSPPVARPADTAQAEARIAVAVTETRWRTLLRTALPLLGVATAVALGTYAARQGGPGAAAREVVRFQLPLPEGQVLSLARRVVALSPDGRELAYVTDTQLFVRRMADFQPTPLGVEAGQAITSPVYSPDGAWLAFHSGTDRALKRVSTRGGAPSRLCEIAPPGTLSWEASGLLVGAGPQGILRCDPAGGPPEQLVKPGDGETLIAPQILHGGTMIMFTVGRTSDVPAVRWDRASIVAQSLQTGERRIIVQAGSDSRYLDTGHLLYRYGGVLYAVPFDVERLELRGEPVPVIDGIMRGTNGTTQMALAPNGTLVYMPGPVGINSNERELAIGDRAGVITRLSLAAGPFVHVRVNREASLVALGSDNGKDAIVWIYALDGQSAARRLTLEGQNRYPIWSPDGRWITFQSDRSGNPGIYRQRADGTGSAERLTTAAAGSSHMPESWSPDGRHLAFAIRTEGPQGPDYALHVLSAADGNTAPLGNVRSREPIGAVFSPDGRWVAYSSTPTDDVSAANRGVFVQPFPPSGAVFQAPRQLVDFHPVWSADGRELVFLASTNARQMVATRVAVNGGLTFGTPSRFPASVTGERLSAEPRSFDLMPDGRLIGVVTRSDTGSSIYSSLRVVLNWIDELKQRVPSN